MARALFIFLLPSLLSLLGDATARNDLLIPFRKQESNEKMMMNLLPPLHLAEAVSLSTEQKPLIRLPSESENEMMMEVPQLLNTPWQRVRVSTETDKGISASSGLREGESNFRERESDSIFLVIGRKGLRFDNPSVRCRQHHHHEGRRMKFRHFQGDGDHLRFRPDFLLSSEDAQNLHVLSSEDRRLQGEKTIPSFRSFHGQFFSGAENEESGFEPRERAFERSDGKAVFPEREPWDWESPNEEEQKHERREDPVATWMDWLRSLFPCHRKLR